MQLINDRYELLEVISSGGMATVWRAWDTRLERFVAVKRPHPSAPGDDSSAQLGREARAAASLSHPNLVTVFDFGTDETGPYLVMELVDGPTLQEMSGVIDADAAVDIGGQLADALATIHAAGIVHRDVKPSNVIMSERGPLLTDFGIAAVPGATATLTVPGKVLATPAYAAPEVLAGTKPTPASDVYSLGMTISSLVGGPASLPEGGVADIVSAAVSQQPEVRPDAAELADGLRHGGTGEMSSGGDPTLLLTATPPHSPTNQPPSDPEPGNTRRGSTPSLVAAAVVVAIATGLVLLGLTRADQDRTAGAEVTPEVTTTLTPVTSTTVAPTTTVPPTTTTTSPLPPEEQIRNQLEAVLVGASGMDDGDVRRVMGDVDQAIAAAADGNEKKTEREFWDAARRVDREVDDEETRNQAFSLLVDLANQLGVDIDQGDGDDDD